MRRLTLLRIVTTMAATSVLCGPFSYAEDVDFNRDIRPLLSDNCFQCHGPDAEHREADLRLDVEAAAKEAAVVAGDLESPLIERIISTDSDEVMPPLGSGKQLEPAEIELLRQWIQQGAKWEGHWAYEAPRQHPLPANSAANRAASGEWSKNWIDQFILQRLAKEELQPSPTAEPVTLVRRLYFDLLGLPPTQEQVAEFVRDRSDKAYESLVDRLLNSSHFGERMAIYWLDLVRYADTVGYHGDQDQNISPYRDYVIDAFNRNLRFDQFTREQLAGDLLPDPTIDQRIATGYNRLLQTSHEGGVQPKEYLSIYQADRVRNVSAVWLGGTLGCAQCHDHKYDPYTAKDFYSMAAFFADIDEEQHFKKGTNSLPTARPPELDVLHPRDRQKHQQLTAQIDSLSHDAEGQPECEEALAENAELKQLKRARKRLDKTRRRTMVTVGLPTPRTVRLFPRGNWLDESGPVLQPAVPEFLGTLPSKRRASRLDLANWLTNAADGAGLLTARVMANRFWYLLFGHGLCESLDDFGGQGKPPEHPELLDNLAIEFASNGWDVKQLLKLMLMSQTYQQSSVCSDALRTRDPMNALFARQSTYRLPAEVIRDAALSAGGLLVDEFGGASVKPYQPFGYYRHLNFPQRRYAHHADQRQWRRGVYVHWQRQFLHPMLKAFDAPSREECTAQRPHSNTPLAALVLLNDPTFVEAARGLAVRLLADANSTPEQQEGDTMRIARAFQLVVSREPVDVELDALRELLKITRAEYQSNDGSAEALLSIGEKSHETENPMELAAWTAVARAVLNLSESTTRQ